MGVIKIDETNLANLISVYYDDKILTVTKMGIPYCRWLSFNGYQRRKAKPEEVVGTFFDLDDHALDFHYIVTYGFGNRVDDRDSRFNLDYKKLNDIGMTYDFELLANMPENEMGIGVLTLIVPKIYNINEISRNAKKEIEVFEFPYL